jgi:hypothetical protein
MTVQKLSHNPAPHGLSFRHLLDGNPTGANFVGAFRVQSLDELFELQHVRLFAHPRRARVFAIAIAILFRAFGGSQL